MAALLLAVAQQSPHNVRWLGANPVKTALYRHEISAEAKEFVASDGFDEWCEQLNVSTAVYREMSPDEAFAGFRNLIAMGEREGE